MQGKGLVATTVAVLAMAPVLSSASQADDLDNVVRIGYAHVTFGSQPADLTGPPGTTPPGLGMRAENLDALGISYERRLSQNWSVQLQAGVPPKLTAAGAGVAQPVGTVATARIWFPTAMALYTFTEVPIIRPYVGLGVTYTWFTDEKASSAYTAALQGTSSSISLSDSWGPFARIGFECPIDKNWSVNMEYSAFRVDTTATVVTQTPGVGPITRRVNVKDSPRIFGLTVGYRF